jgi:hypothetical protein
MADFDAGDVRLEDPEADRLMVSTPELWRYFPRLLAYPLRGFALPVVIVMGACLWFCGYAGLLGIAAMGILFGWLGHYTMGVVARTAVGHAIPPPLGTEVLFEGEKLRLGLLVMYIVTLLLMAYPLTRPGHPAWGVLVFVAGVYLFPAFLATLALQPDLLSALNPLNTLLFAWHTGLSYLFACLALAGVGFLCVVLSGHVAGAVTSMLMIYALLFVCHLIGYVAYHRQESLDLAVSVEKPTEETLAAVAQGQRLGAVLAAVDQHLEAKDPRAACDAILKETAADVANPRAFHEELFDSLRQRHQDALSLVQAARLIQLLAREKRYARALDIWEQCLDFAKGFVPQPESLVGALAEQAVKDKRMALFVRLDTAVHARQPQGEAAASLQFLKAQALVAQKQDDAALALLTPLLSASGHPWAARIQALHKALSGLKKPPA